MKIIAFAGSNSSTSINKKLVTYVSSYFEGHTIEILDLNDYEMPLFSVDRLAKDGIPQLTLDFAEKIDSSDFLLISLAENNGAYTTAFKNIFDWLSMIPERPVFGNKPMFLLSTSPGARGGASVMEIAKNRMPHSGGKVIETFSLPSFYKSFVEGKGITNIDYATELVTKIEKIKDDLLM